MIRRPPRSTLFPSPPLFRSDSVRKGSECELPFDRVAVERPGFQFRDPPLRFSLFQFRHAVSLIAAAAEQRTVFRDRKSTRLNSSHLVISYAVFCLKKKKHIG